MVAANGSPWIYVGESIGNDRYYVNIESIKPGSTIALRDATKAWWKTVGPNNAEPPRLYRSLVYLSQAAIPDRIKLS